MPKYGFRYDPMTWVRNSDALEAARLRTLLFKEPKPGDAQRLEDEIRAIRREAEQDGWTVGHLWRLSRLGCSPDDPDIHKAIDRVCGEKAAEEGGLTHLGALRVAAWGSWEGDGALRKGAQELADRIARLEIGKGCPWGDEESVWALWCVREYADADAALEHGLSAMRDAIQEGKGWPVYVDPWGFVECASNVDHPLAREIVVRELPVILRGQLPDGSWNEDDYYGTGNMITALVRHGLFELLRKAPSLPADWRIARTIPAPKGDLGGMTWDGKRLWVYDKESGDAIALSIDDGKILARAKMPAGAAGLAWHRDSLVAVKGEGRAIQHIDPETGEASEPVPVDIPWGALSAITAFDGGLCVTHLYRGSVHFIDGPLPFNSDPETALVLGGCGAIDMTSAGATIWCIDFLGPTIIAGKPHDDGRIVDWGEKPFGSHTTGIAHDGKNLWVLDNKGKRVCIIEKANAARKDTRKVLEGVPPLARRGGKQCTFMAALEAVLRYYGESYDYADLMGLSAAAFRVRLAKSTWEQIMGGRIHPGISIDAPVGPHMKAITAATGYGFELHGHFTERDGDAEQVAKLIQKEIDEGRPIIAMNLHNGSCWGVIAGYDPGAELKGGGEMLGGRFLCRTVYDAKGSKYQPAREFPWDLWFVKPAREPKAEEDAIHASIKLAVQLLSTPEEHVNLRGGWMWHWEPVYKNGLAAYDAWIDDLADEEGIQKLEPEQYLNYWQGNAWLYDQLHDARRAAMSYLMKIASKCADEERTLLQKGSRICEQLVRYMTENWSCFPYWRGEYRHGTGWRLSVEQADFLGHRVPAYADEWTTDTRRKGLEVLKAIQAKDKEALGVLEEVLRVMEARR